MNKEAHKGKLCIDEFEVTRVIYVLRCLSPDMVSTQDKLLYQRLVQYLWGQTRDLMKDLLN